MQMVVFDQCCTGADTQKTTQLMCSASVADAVRARLGHHMCNHAAGTHAPIVGEKVRRADGSTGYRTKLAQQFSGELNASIAEALLDPSGEGGWMQAVGAVVGAYTNTAVQRLSYFAADLRAQAIETAGSPLLMLREMLDMHAELGESPESLALLADVSPIAAAMCAQLDAQCVAGPGAHVGNMSVAMAFAVARAKRGTTDDPAYEQAIRGPEREQWLEAMQLEYHNLTSTGDIFPECPEDGLSTWDAAKGRASEVVDMIWVLKKKYGAMRELLKHKARKKYLFKGLKPRFPEPELIDEGVGNEAGDSQSKESAGL